MKKALFNNDNNLKNSMNFVLEDKEEIKKYQIEEIRNKVILGDAFKVLKKIDDEVFDMVFIDPPYFLQLPDKKLRRWTVKTVVEGVNDDWDKFYSFQEYDDFIQKLLMEVKRIMKPNATPMPNWLGVRFTNATETLIWAVKDKKSKKYTFNKEYAKSFGIGKVGANVWVLPICTGNERIKDKNGKKLHSTQKPIELLKRVILTSTKEGNLILDPMAGSGTTGYVAQALKRDFVMIEINPKYVKGIAERFKYPVKITEYSLLSKKHINKYMNLEELK